VRMSDEIYFHARRSKNPLYVNLELWKSTSMLGVWVLTQEKAEVLALELAKALQPPAKPTDD